MTPNKKVTEEVKSFLSERKSNVCLNHAKKLLSLLVVSCMLSSSVMAGVQETRRQEERKKRELIEQTKRELEARKAKYSKDPSTLHYKSDEYVMDILEKAKIAFTLQAVETKSLLTINYFNESNDHIRAKLLLPFIKSNEQEFEAMIPANYEINMLGQPPVKKAMPLPNPSINKRRNQLGF
jgi:hypothetical protein